MYFTDFMRNLEKVKNIFDYNSEKATEYHANNYESIYFKGFHTIIPKIHKYEFFLEIKDRSGSLLEILS